MPQKRYFPSGMKHSAPTFRTNSSFLCCQLCKNVYILRIYGHLQVFCIFPSPVVLSFTFLQTHSLFLHCLCSQERLFGARTQLGVTPRTPPREGLGAPRQRVPGLTQLCWQHLGAATGWHNTSSIQCFCSSNRAASLGRAAAAAEGAISRKKNPTTTSLKHLLRAQLPRPAQEAQSRQELLQLPDGSSGI